VYLKYNIISEMQRTRRKRLCLS